MTFDLLPGITGFMTIVYAVVVLAQLLALAVVVDFLVVNRRQRTRRRQTVPAYYKHLLLPH